MFSYFIKKIKFIKLKKVNEEEQNKKKIDQDMKTHKDLDNNLETFQKILGKSDDIVIRKIEIGKKTKIKAALIFMDGLANKNSINENLILPLMYYADFPDEDKHSKKNFQALEFSLLSVGEVEQSNLVNKLIDKCLYGDVIFIVDGFKDALIIDAKGWDSRNISEPTNEVTVRGPREGFTETLRVNTSLLRRKIRDPNLTFETIKLGERTQTHVSIIYLRDLANPEIVDTLRKRLKTIQIDGILDSGYIDEFIEDAPYSIFSTIGRSERPDTVASKILEGRVALLVDGTPIALTVPKLFIESFQSPEDYYSRSYYSSMVRLIRFVSFFISILAPGTYIAISTFHQEMIPTPLLITMIESRAGVPFPAFLECLVMVVSFEILKEAGIRLPRSVGQAVSIVGALVIGESAVSAGLIGEPMVIVIAVTAIASFVIPDLSDIAGILRLIFIILAGIAGAYGIILGLLAMTIHLINLESFGISFLSPIVPLDLQGLKDSLVRFPLWTFNRRSKALKPQDSVRQNFIKGKKQHFQTNNKR